MEKQVFIKQVFPLTERQYTAKDGSQQVFASRGMLLTTGIDEVYGEVSGDTARALPEAMDNGKTCFVQGTMKARQWQDKNGQTRFENQLIITKIV